MYKQHFRIGWHGTPAQNGQALVLNRLFNSRFLLLENGLIERGRDLDEDAGSTVYRITSWGRVVLGVGELAVQ